MNTQTSHTINWVNAIVAGIIGGLVAHYGNGIAIAIIYAALAPSLFGPAWVRALSFITVQTVLGVWLFMLPLLGAGIAGIDLNKLLPVITLVRHFAYAIPFIFLIQIPRTSITEKCDLSATQSV